MQTTSQVGESSFLRQRGRAERRHTLFFVFQNATDILLKCHKLSLYFCRQELTRHALAHCWHSARTERLRHSYLDWRNHFDPLYSFSQSRVCIGTHIYRFLEVCRLLFPESVHLLLDLTQQDWIQLAAECAGTGDCTALHRQRGGNLFPQVPLLFSELLCFLRLLSHALCQLEMWKTDMFRLCIEISMRSLQD